MASSNSSDPNMADTPPAPRHVLIAPDGVITFTLTAGGQDTIIRVSSVVLSYASPVFRSLLGPKFAEGQTERSAARP